MISRRLRAVTAFVWFACLQGACKAQVREPVARAVNPTIPSPASPQATVKPSALPVSLRGRVVDAEGRPIAGSLVSASVSFDPRLPDPGHEVLSDPEGWFQFVGLPPGRYGITATSPHRGAAYGGVRVVATEEEQGASPLVLQLGPPGSTFRGTVRDDRGMPLGGARVLAAAFSENEGETYVVLADAQGHYRVNLPAGQQYMLAADAGPRPRASRPVGPASQTVDFQLDPVPAPRPSDQVIRTWLQAQAIPLSDGLDLDDDAADAFSGLVADASIVAMGEATHGSREFSAWRHRVFKALVREKGFTVYAGETPWAEALAVNDYVVHGKGNAKTAIAGLLTWKDNTEELLAFVEWMRSYNLDPTHSRKLQFAGFDILTPRAVTLLLEYLRLVDSDLVAKTKRTLAPFSSVHSDQTYPSLPPSERQQLRAELRTLGAKLDANRSHYVVRAGTSAWIRARQCARVIEQASSSYADDTTRDQFLFENVQWLIKHHSPDSKFLLYAHNKHIAAEQVQLAYLGKLLRQHWGERYMPIGFSFGEGSLRALDWTRGMTAIQRTFRVGPAPPGTFDYDLSLTSHPRFVIDLRNATGPIRQWLQSGQRMRNIGGGFSGPGNYTMFTPSRAFDAIIYLKEVTAISM